MSVTINYDWKKLSNKELGKKLVRKENIDILENIIDKTIEECRSIPDKKNSKDITLSKQQLKQELRNINVEVNKFLNVKNSNLPSIAYKDLFTSFQHDVNSFLYLFAGSSLLTISGLLLTNEPIIAPMTIGALGVYYLKQFNDSCMAFSNTGSEYYNFGNLMLISKNKRKEIISDIAHEQTHHIQKLLKWPIGDKNYQVLNEGLARGVERHVSRLYAEREDDKSIIKKTLNRSLYEYRGIYMIMCNRMNKNVNVNLINKDTEYKPGLHALGNTLFSISEEKYGTKIYSNALRGNLLF